MCLCAVHVMCDQLSSKNEHEWIGAGLKNEVKKNERTMFVGTKTYQFFSAKKGMACVLVSQHLSTLAL